MFTVMLFTGLVYGAAIAIDAKLAADARIAMKRADLTLDFVSRATGVPLSRLSDQLNGKTPFTSFWRLFAAPEMRATDFLLEFLDIQAEYVDRVVVRDLGGLLTKVDALLLKTEALIGISQRPKRMAKAELVDRVLTHTVELPMRREKEQAS